MGDLKGVRIAFLEARMSSELTDLVRRQGGEPYAVPAVRESLLDCSEQVVSFIDGLSHNSFQIVVFLTGVGVNTLFQEAQRLGLISELVAGLKNVIIVCRGPKPSVALKRNGLQTLVSVQEPYTTKELLEAISKLDLLNKGVALIHYGEQNSTLTNALQASGARLTELCLYEWLMPEDTTPLNHLVQQIINAQVEVVVFTSQIQARHLFQVASDQGLELELGKALNQLTVVSIGPTCTSVLRSLGIEPDVEPEHPKMAPMVIALVQYLNQKA
ncbi:MAG: uroporphyrinogen-III synthase [Acidobacteriota bacterium]